MLLVIKHIVQYETELSFKNIYVLTRKTCAKQMLGDYICIVSKLFTVITYYFTIRKKNHKNMLSIVQISKGIYINKTLLHSFPHVPDFYHLL